MIPDPKNLSQDQNLRTLQVEYISQLAAFKVSSQNLLNQMLNYSNNNTTIKPLTQITEDNILDQILIQPSKTNIIIEEDNFLNKIFKQPKQTHIIPSCPQIRQQQLIEEQWRKTKTNYLPQPKEIDPTMPQFRELAPIHDVSKLPFVPEDSDPDTLYEEQPYEKPFTSIDQDFNKKENKQVKILTPVQKTPKAHMPIVRSSIKNSKNVQLKAKQTKQSIQNESPISLNTTELRQTRDNRRNKNNSIRGKQWVNREPIVGSVKARITEFNETYIKKYTFHHHVYLHNYLLRYAAQLKVNANLRKIPKNILKLLKENNSTYCSTTIPIHGPTVKDCANTLTPFLTNSYVNFKIVNDGYYSQAEHSYWFGLSVLQHVIQQLTSYEEYEVGEANTIYTAMEVIYYFLVSYNKPLPHMHLLEIMTEKERTQLESYLLKPNAFRFSFNHKNYMIGINTENFLLQYFMKTSGSCYLFPFPVVSWNLVNKK